MKHSPTKNKLNDTALKHLAKLIATRKISHEEAALLLILDGQGVSSARKVHKILYKHKEF